MKLTTLFLLVTLFQMKANAGYSQNTKISLSFKETAIEEIFKEIEAKTEFRFMYKIKDLDLDKKYTFDVKDKSVKKVLNQLFKGTNVSFELFENRQIVLLATEEEKKVSFATVNNTFIENPKAEIAIIISGKVTDDKGLPLPGVSLVVKGTKKGTVTDSNGEYSIAVDDTNSTLVFSFIGFATQQIVVGDKKQINVTLKAESSSLDEVVIVGYGKQKKLEVTSAVSQINGKEILKSQAFSVTNSLSGRVPGLIVNQRSGRPGGDDANIFIRGISTTGNNAPLIVVDGVANRDGISRLDPNEIETITVLKDASAAIYGAQSGNGVILVTTKRGESGKPTVSFSSSYGLVSPTRYIKPSDGATYARGLNDVDLQNGATPRFSAQQIADYESGKLPTTNWSKAVYKDNFSQARHSLSVRGGNDAVKYYLSTGFGEQGTLIVGDDKSKYNQFNFRSNIDATVSEYLTVGLDLSGRRENRNFPGVDDGNIWSWVILTSPHLPATILGGYPAAGRGNNNPLAVVASDSYDRTENNVLAGTFKAQLKIPGVEGLSIDGFAAFDYFQTFRKFWKQPWTYYTDVNGVPVPTQRLYGPDLSVNSQQNESLTLNGKINYKRSFGLHNIDAFVSYEQNQTKFDFVSAYRTGYVSPVIDQIFAGSPVKSNQDNGGSAGQGARQNYLSRISYSYDNKYLAQFYIGINGSQIFPEETRFGTFPGGSIGWVLSKESFMNNVSFVSNLKLRASYGLLGNDRVAQFQYLNLFTFGTGYVFNGLDVAALNPGVAANPNITWEKKESADFGVDFGLFNNSLTGTIDYFKSRTSDILARKNATVPNYTGLSLPNENIGIVDNSGFDGELNYTRKINELRFNVGFNFTYVKNKVVFIDEVAPPPSAAHQTLTGKPIGTSLIYKSIGIYQNAADLAKYPGLPGVRIGDLIYEDYNKDGKLNSDDRVTQELTSTPRLQYGFNFGADWKGFDFVAQFMGQEKVVQELTYLFGDGNNAPEFYVKNAWSPTNTGASLPRLQRTFRDNDVFLRDVSFLRLKNIEIGYSIPKTVLSSIGFQSLRLYINGANLLTFDKLKKDGLGDPESVERRNFVFPISKIISFGINANF